MKFCRKCKTEKPREAFYIDPRRGTQISPCKQCRIALVSTANHKWRQEHPERSKESGNRTRLKLAYGITPERLVGLLAEQGGACAICLKKLSLVSVKKATKPHIDHNHVTREVRGLLCLTCNTGLGMFGDSQDLLDAAKKYLQ